MQAAREAAGLGGPVRPRRPRLRLDAARQKVLLPRPVREREHVARRAVAQTALLAEQALRPDDGLRAPRRRGERGRERRVGGRVGGRDREQRDDDARRAVAPLDLVPRGPRLARVRHEGVPVAVVGAGPVEDLLVEDALQDGLAGRGVWRGGVREQDLRHDVGSAVAGAGEVVVGEFPTRGPVAQHEVDDLCENRRRDGGRGPVFPHEAQQVEVPRPVIEVLVEGVFAVVRVGVAGREHLRQQREEGREGLRVLVEGGFEREPRGQLDDDAVPALLEGLGLLPGSVFAGAVSGAGQVRVGPVGGEGGLRRTRRRSRYRAR